MSYLQLFADFSFHYSLHTPQNSTLAILNLYYSNIDSILKRNIKFFYSKSKKQ